MCVCASLCVCVCCVKCSPSWPLESQRERGGRNRGGERENKREREGEIERGERENKRESDGTPRQIPWLPSERRAPSDPPECGVTSRVHEGPWVC